METVADQAAETTDKARSVMSEDLESVKVSFQHLRTDVMELLSSAFGLGKTGAGFAKGEADHAVAAMKAKLTGLKDKGSEKVQSLEGKISENPIPAALIAFGIGFLIAKVLARR